MDPKIEGLWLTWNPGCRRSQMLARHLNFPICEFRWSGNKILRQFAASVWSTYVLIKLRPDKLVVQHSFLLSFIAVALKKAGVGVRIVIVDAHTHSLSRELHGAGQFIYQKIKRFIFRASDAVVVTNKNLVAYVEKRGGKAFVLPDMLPQFSNPKVRPLSSRQKNITYVCSHSSDEPIEEVLRAAAILGNGCRIYITGTPEGKTDKIHVPSNVVFTGYLPDADYVNLLFSSALIVVLTKTDNCMVCGAYEAISLEKPLILSNKQVLREYFRKGVVFSDNDSGSLARAIIHSLKNAESLVREIRVLKRELDIEWSKQWESFCQTYLEISHVESKRQE